MTTTTCLKPALVVSVLPTAGEPVCDPVIEEWTLIDSDGVSYFGDSPAECIAQFHQALHYLADHYHKCPSDAELPRNASRQP